MSHADATSRAPTEEATDTMDEVIENCLEVLTVRSERDEVAAMQHSDTRVAELISILKTPATSRTKQQAARVQQYLLKDNLLYRVVKEGDNVKYLWEVPSSMRKSIVVKYHDLSGHFAVDRTVAKIQERYYFPKMRRYVRYHINCCPECLLTKLPRGKRPGELHPILPGNRPFEVVNVDHTGPFVQSTQQWQDIHQIQMAVRERIKEEHEQWKLRYNSKHSSDIKYNVGEIVYLKRAPQPTGESTKLQDKFRGPMVVTKVYPTDSYSIASLSNKGDKHYATTAHVSNLKSYHLPIYEDSEQGNDDKKSEQAGQSETEEPVSKTTNQQVESESESEEEIPMGRTKRQTHRPKYLDNYI